VGGESQRCEGLVERIKPYMGLIEEGKNYRRITKKGNCHTGVELGGYHYGYARKELESYFLSLRRREEKTLKNEQQKTKKKKNIY